MGGVRLLAWLSPVVETEAIDWDDVYREELPRVYSFFRYRVGHRETAEDLTSITFEKAWRARDRYRRDRALVSTWILSIARNVAIDHYRGGRREIPLDGVEAPGTETPETRAIREADRERLAALLATLPERERELVALKYGAGLTNPGHPAWGMGMEPGAGSVSLRVEPGRHYHVVAPDGVLSPRVSAPLPTSLKSTRHQADYILIAPRAFLPAAQALLERRQSQGLRTMAASLEEIASAFGHGEPSGEAIRSFLTFAYHSWQGPSPRYVLLLGDASHDPRNFIGSSAPAPLPALFLRTSYLVTASDPALAAVNGEDLLPDMAIGRLPVQTAEEAEALIAKILAWEDSGQGLSGRTVLVADNPDEAGDFEWDVDDLATRILSGRETLKILLSQEGASTRSRILEAFDEGASFMSYVGHGGAAVWATENVLNSWDVASLQAQSTQSVMLTMNCLNGYFVAPAFDSLGEAYLKVPGRGTIASFSPSGLSVDAPAHQLHLALMRELTSGEHERLGDAIVAAQQAYAETGLMPELLDIYHLLGDPATRIR